VAGRRNSFVEEIGNLSSCVELHHFREKLWLLVAANMVTRLPGNCGEITVETDALSPSGGPGTEQGTRRFLRNNTGLVTHWQRKKPLTSQKTESKLSFCSRSYYSLT
jgi:hypothetical protein